jgi:hypothetical protein
MADLVLPIRAGSGLVVGNPRPGSESGLIHGICLIGSDPIQVQQHLRHRAGANRQADIAQIGQQGQ